MTTSMSLLLRLCSVSLKKDESNSSKDDMMTGIFGYYGIRYRESRTYYDLLFFLPFMMTTVDVLIHVHVHNNNNINILRNCHPSLYLLLTIPFSE